MGREAVVNLRLRVGQISENLTVTGEAPLIETTNASTAGLIDETQMRNLPLNGHSFIEPATLTPEVQIFEDTVDAAPWFDDVHISEMDRLKIGRTNALQLFKLASTSAGSPL